MTTIDTAMDSTSTFDPSDENARIKQAMVDPTVMQHWMAMFQRLLDGKLETEISKLDGKISSLTEKVDSHDDKLEQLQREENEVRKEEKSKWSKMESRVNKLEQERQTTIS